MKNIRTITRGSNGVALEFTSKKSSSLLEYIGGIFKFNAPIEYEGLQAILDRITALESAVSTLQSDYTALEARVTALETP